MGAGQPGGRLLLQHGRNSSLALALINIICSWDSDYRHIIPLRHQINLRDFETHPKNTAKNIYFYSWMNNVSKTYKV